MADRYLTPSLTDEGLAMIIRSLNGETVTFTKLVLGNGTPPDLNNVTEMANPLLNVPFTDSEAEESYLLLTGAVSSADIETSFYGKELGVFAKVDDEEEVLYAYRYSETADFYPASDSGRTLELTVSVVVQVGTAENVTAILVEGDAFASKEEFDDHVGDTENPHGVTKAQVGLSNVPNVSTNNQTPTFTQASTRTNIVSGETLSAMLGKIAKLFVDFATHISASNPHNITTTKINASPVGHQHAVSDITSGTLSVARGGSGVSQVNASTVISSIVTAASGFSISQAQICWWGKVATLHIAVTRTGADTSGNTTICTLKAGYRPRLASPAGCNWDKNAVVNTDGTIKVNGSFVKNSGYGIYATYVLQN